MAHGRACATCRIIATPPAGPAGHPHLRRRSTTASSGRRSSASWAAAGRSSSSTTASQTIHAMAASACASWCPRRRSASATGRCRRAQLEKVMVDFVDRRHDVLVCTTIIESGLDIPRANTMIVNRADSFGLAQLYQLRGRVGRSARARLLLPAGPARGGASPATRKQRLRGLAAFTELGAGFQIAIARSGDPRRGQPAGCRSSAAPSRRSGFDIYTQLLEEAVAELRGEPPRGRSSIRRSRCRCPALIPDDYVPGRGSGSTSTSGWPRPPAKRRSTR